MGSCEGKAALVTGGSRGIGRAIALRLAAEGAAVAVCARNVEAAEGVAAEIAAAGGKSLALRADVAVADQVKELVGVTLEGLGGLDILVNNAGITRDNLLMRMSEEEWDQVLETNLKGAFNCCKAAMRPMLKARGGRIVNISSVVGISGNPGQANYVASKAGLIGFTKTLARELASRQITANVVAPGLVPETGMTGDLPEKLKDQMIAQVPLGARARPKRWPTPFPSWLRPKRLILPARSSASTAAWSCDKTSGDSAGDRISVIIMAATKAARSENRANQTTVSRECRIWLRSTTGSATWWWNSSASVQSRSPNQLPSSTTWGLTRSTPSSWSWLSRRSSASISPTRTPRR